MKKNEKVWNLHKRTPVYSRFFEKNWKKLSFFFSKARFDTIFMVQNTINKGKVPHLHPTFAIVKITELRKKWN